MTSRERVKRAIHFEAPDVPPLRHGIVGGTRTVDPKWAREMYVRFPDDFGIANDNTLPSAGGKFFTRGEPYTDAWGCTRQCITDGLQAVVIKHPLADPADLPTHEPPCPERAPYDEINEQILKAGHPRYVQLGIGGLFEHMQNLRGTADLCCDFYDEHASIARDLADMVFGVMLKNVQYICETEADCVYMGDDWGTEQAMLISPDLWRGFFKPYCKQIVDYAHSHGKDVWLHSCGVITEIIPDIIELGIDVLHPQMERLMEDETFLPAIRGRLCLETDIDRGFLCVASPEAVYDRTIATFGKVYQPDGGMILRGEIGISVPHANAEAFYRACHDFQESVKEKEH